MGPTIRLPTLNGSLDFFYFNHNGQSGVVAHNPTYQNHPFVRIHSSCIFSESFKTQDCDCSKQLEAALKHIEVNGGVIIYLYQEGRGLGLENKIKAIHLEQKEGIDTATAFSKLGYTADPRSYDAAIFVLKQLGIQKVTLATDNPLKTKALIDNGIEVVDRISLEIETNPQIESYLSNKRQFLGHHEKD